MFRVRSPLWGLGGLLKGFLVLYSNRIVVHIVVLIIFKRSSRNIHLVRLYVVLLPGHSRKVGHRNSHVHNPPAHYTNCNIFVFPTNFCFSKNWPMTERESQVRNYDAAFGTVFRISSKCFLSSTQNLYVYLSLQQGSLKFEKHQRQMYRQYHWFH
jgi:hypothetical protein